MQRLRTRSMPFKAEQDFSDTLLSMNNLAWTYYQLDQAKAAEDFVIELLHQRRNALGVDHPDTLRAAKDLVLIQQRAIINAKIMTIGIFFRRKQA
jgi:hypothetical protein